MSITVENLDLGYDGKLIVKSANLEIEKGKITILIGPNGCGKSTLLKGMSRLIKPINGTIKLNNQIIKEIPAKVLAKKLAILPQAPVAPEGTTVRELCYFGRHPHRQLFTSNTKKDHEKVDWAIEVTGLKEYEHTYLEELSGGQRQRAWIAMALVQETDVLFLDEPTTYLDLSFQLEVLKLLKELNQQFGMTIVIVLHELNQAARFADCLICMKSGEIIQKGAVSEVFNEQMLKDVFGLSGMIIDDPLHGCPMYIAR